MNQVKYPNTLNVTAKAYYAKNNQPHPNINTTDLQDRKINKLCLYDFAIN